MRNRPLRSRLRATLYTAVAFGILPGPACYAQTNPDASPVQFDVVSVKMHDPANQSGGIQLTPDGIRLTNLPLPDYIREAYGLAVNDQLVGIPSWAGSKRFDVEAKVDSAHVAAFRKLTLDQVRLMGRQILTERFKLASHEEKRVLPLYALVVAKDGSRLQRSTMSSDDPNARTGTIGMRHASNSNGTMNELTARGVTMDQLASALSKQGFGRVVLDNTGLTDRYDFRVTWASGGVTADPNSVTTSGPSIFTAITEQLGLKLEAQKGPVPVLVVDHIEEPSPN